MMKVKRLLIQFSIPWVICLKYLISTVESASIRVQEELWAEFYLTRFDAMRERSPNPQGQDGKDCRGDVGLYPETLDCP